MKSKDIDILKKRIKTLEARLVGINEKWSCYHEINQEYKSLKRILEFIENFGQKKSL